MSREPGPIYFAGFCQLGVPSPRHKDASQELVAGPHLPRCKRFVNEPHSLFEAVIRLGFSQPLPCD